MRVEASGPYGDVRAAKLAGGELRQHDVYMLDQRRTLVLGVALGPPRLWSYLLEVTLMGFVEGYRQPHDGRACTRLSQGLLSAQQRLRARADALIERRLPDVGLLALGLQGREVHVVSAGPLQAHLLHHGGRCRRLGPPAEAPSVGLLGGTSSWSSHAVVPGELLLATSLSACDPATLRELELRLEREPELPSSDVVGLLNGAPGANGLPAVAVAMRVPTH